MLEIDFVLEILKNTRKPGLTSSLLFYVRQTNNSDTQKNMFDESLEERKTIRTLDYNPAPIFTRGSISSKSNRVTKKKVE